MLSMLSRFINRFRRENLSGKVGFEAPTEKRPNVPRLALLASRFLD